MMLEPTQADREAANLWVRAQKVGVQMMLTHPTDLYQAFARHRQATEQAIIAWLNDMKREDTNWPKVIARMIEEGQHRG